MFCEDNAMLTPRVSGSSETMAASSSSSCGDKRARCRSTSTDVDHQVDCCYNTPSDRIVRGAPGTMPSPKRSKLSSSSSPLSLRRGGQQQQQLQGNKALPLLPEDLDEGTFSSVPFLFQPIEADENESLPPARRALPSLKPRNQNLLRLMMVPSSSSNAAVAPASPSWDQDDEDAELTLFQTMATTSALLPRVRLTSRPCSGDRLLQDF